MSEQVIDVADEPQTRPIPQQELSAAAERSRVDSDNVAIAPEPGSAINTMRDKLEKLMKEAIPANATPDKKIEQAKPELKKEVADEKKPEAKADEAKVEEAKEPETITSAKAADWKKLKEARAAAEKERDEFKTRLLQKENEFLQVQTKLKVEDKSPEFTKQIDELKAEKEKLIAQIEAIDLERSPRFSEHFNKAFQSSLARVKEAVGDGLASQAESVVQLPPSKWRKEKLNEIRENLSGIDQGQFDIAIAEWDRATAEKGEALSKSRENYSKLKTVEAEDRKREEAMQLATVARTVDSAIQSARAYKAFQPIENDHDHNAAVKLNEERIGKFFRMELPVGEIAAMPIIAAEGRRLMEKEIPALQAKIAELTEALTQAKASNPGLKGGKQGALQGGEPKGFVQTFQENWPGGQQ